MELMHRYDKVINDMIFSKHFPTQYLLDKKPRNHEVCAKNMLLCVRYCLVFGSFTFLTYEKTIQIVRSNPSQRLTIMTSFWGLYC